MFHYSLMKISEYLMLTNYLKLIGDELPGIMSIVTVIIETFMKIGTSKNLQHPLSNQ